MANPVLSRLAGIRPAAHLVAGLLIFLVASLFAMSGDSCTFDEGAHLSTGYAYVTLGDFRMMPEHPPLAKNFSALPLLLLDPRLSNDKEIWRTSQYFDLGFHFLYQSGNDADRLLFWGRVPTLFWSILLLVSIYAVARELYGERGGLVAFWISVFCPTLLAHGHLVTNDIAMTALSFLTIVSFRMLFQKITALRAFFCGMLLGGAFLTKLSAIFLLPIIAILGTTAFFRRRASVPAADGPPAAANPPPFRQKAIPALLLLLVPLLVYALIWAGYRFRFEGSPDPGFKYSWYFPIFNAGSASKVVAFARDHRLFPEAFLNGLATVSEMTAQRASYALGRHSDSGWRWYFPFAFLVKTPIPLVLLIGWGLHGAIRRFSRGDRSEEFLIVALIVYWVTSVMSSFNIGIRHLLPVHPYMLVLAGGIDLSSVHEAAARWKRRALPVLIGGVGVSCLWGAPCFLAYFNLPSRLIDKPYFLLTDSNLDWGQDLGRLKRYMDANGIPEIKMAYHGSASPRHLKLRHEYLAGLTWFTQYVQKEPEWKQASEPRSGDIVAINATSLVGLVLQDKEFFLRRLGKLKPVAEIGGGAILVYRMP